MEDEDLKRYLPRYGDRIAVIAFSKQELGKKKTVSDRKLSLREKLIAKLQNKQGSSEHMKRSLPQTGNTNAKRMSRKIELGWLHTYGVHGALKQVRSPSGGGTRTIDIFLDCVIGDLLPVAKGLFFPDGVSKKGTVEDFDFYIADQTQTKLLPVMTIKDLCENTKLKHIRLYMVTVPLGLKINEDTYTETIHGNNDEPAKNADMNHVDDELIEGSNKDEGLVMNEDPGISYDHVDTDGNEACMTDELSDAPTDGSVQSTNISEPGEIMIQGHGAQSQDCSEFGNNNMEQSSVTSSDENDYLQSFLRRSEELEINAQHTSQEIPSTLIIRIHRTLILNELISVFKDLAITNKTLQFIFVNEKGHDSQGLSRDVYAAFWDTFCLKYTDGEDFRIPVLSNELGDTEWEAVGRILLKGYIDLKYFPVRIAPAFFITVCHGENVLTAEILKNSFLSFLSKSEKDILGNALSGIECIQDDLIEILDRFECHCLPDQDNLLPLVLQIAHRVLIQEPKYVMDALQRVGQTFWKAEFSTVDSILAMYEQSEPTAQKVLALFSVNPVSKEQSESLKYLQKFVRGRNKEQLRHFLRFLTGSDMLCVSHIDVNFVVRYGAGRVPTAHTCGPLLDLPSTYVSYPDFRNEWESILQAKENMDMLVA